MGRPEFCSKKQRLCGTPLLPASDKGFSQTPGRLMLAAYRRMKCRTLRTL
jgi:hypothetical protein